MAKFLPLTKLLSLSLVLIVSACAESPATTMTPQQISTLSNTQLCGLHNNYAWDQATEMEIGRRNLICDPAYIECSNRGNKPGTPAMALCMDQLRQNWALQEEVQKKDHELQQKQIELNNQQRWNNILNQSNRPQQLISTPHGVIIQQ
jgi:hypothetical protein